jgi:hypothetical protein
MEWSVSYRGPILIHAHPEYDHAWHNATRLSYIDAAKRHLSHRAIASKGFSSRPPVSMIIGAVLLLDFPRECSAHMDFFDNVYSPLRWSLAHPARFSKPIPLKRTIHRLVSVPLRILDPTDQSLIRALDMTFSNTLGNKQLSPLIGRPRVAPPVPDSAPFKKSSLVQKPARAFKKRLSKKPRPKARTRRPAGSPPKPQTESHRLLGRPKDPRLPPDPKQ